jgi:hypothetical protein
MIDLDPGFRMADQTEGELLGDLRAIRLPSGQPSENRGQDQSYNNIF